MRLQLTILILALTATTINAQFPTIDWDYYTGAPAFGSAASADLDNDGFLEVVFTTYTNDGRAHCLNAEDGSVAWIYDIQGCGDVAPVIYDADGDDTLDVFVNGSCNPTIFCINGHTGALKWSKPSGGGDSPPTIGDVDNDGLPEVLFGNFNGEVRILNAEDGSTALTVMGDPTGNPLQTEPTLVDVDGDNDLDFIVANHVNVDGNYTRAFDFSTGDTIWTNFDTSTATYYSYHGGAVGDIDNDGTMEYVIGSNNGTVRALNVEDGTEQWQRSIPGSIMSAVSLADFDNDNILEVAFSNNDPNTFDERIWILDGTNGSTEWSYNTTFSSFRGCAIGDINGNGQLDVVSGHFMGNVRALEPYSGLIWEHDLQQHFSGSTPWFEADHGPLLADFDQDGMMEVFMVAGYGTYTPDTANTGKAFMMQGGTGRCPEWLMFRHDVRRNAYIPASETQQSCDSLSGMEDYTSGVSFQVYPNPSNGRFVIDVKEENQTDYIIEVVDITGRQVYLQDGLSSASGKVSLNLSGYAEGVYQLLIKTGTGVSSEKILLERR